jgi:pSer/pThr/pTyr-binding forkhead associated (FHA) protein
MDDNQVPVEAVGLPVQGPHRHPGRGPEPTPLRLILLPSGMTVDLTQPEVIVGRHSDADVRLPLPDVSRRHCRFVWRDGTWRVFDMNSLNGIFVNDERVTERVVRNGDAVRIGGFTFRVQFPLGAAGQSKGVLRSIADALPQRPERRAG